MTRKLARACPSPDEQLLVLPGYEHGVQLLAGDAGGRVRPVLHEFLADHTA